MSINKFYESTTSALSTIEEEPVEANSIVNRNYVDALVSSVQNFVKPKGPNLDMRKKRLRNLKEPEMANDAVTKQYVDSKQRLVILHFESDNEPTLIRDADPTDVDQKQIEFYKLTKLNDHKYQFFFSGRGKFSWIKPLNLRVYCGSEQINIKHNFRINKSDFLCFHPLYQQMLKPHPLSAELIIDID